MPVLKFGRWWQAGGWALCLIVLVGAILPDMPTGGVSLSDKFIHSAAFLILTIWFMGAYERARHPNLILALILFGALLEAVQFMLGHRSAEWLDWAADIAGIAAGFALSRVGLARWCYWIERGVLGVA